MSKYNGSDYVPPRDDGRLDAQYDRIFNLMSDRHWRTLFEIEAATGDPSPSISAQLRHMRKPRFGSNSVNKRYIGNGTFEYQLVKAI